METDEAGEALAIAVRTRADTRRLDEHDRQLLSAWLSDRTRPPALGAAARRRRLAVLLVVSGAAAFLVPWTVALGVTLPETERAHAWRIAWVGFDGALIASFAAAAWLGWRSRQAVITAFVVTATLLLCDAWFDLTLSWGSGEQAASILTALAAELPMAAFLLATYHRLLRTVTTQIWRDSGRHGAPPPLRRLPLLVRSEPASEVPLHVDAGSPPGRPGA